MYIQSPSYPKGAYLAWCSKNRREGGGCLRDCGMSPNKAELFYTVNECGK